MIVATVDPDGAPSARTVLLKGVGPDGFRFFTNTASRKGRALAAGPACALLFPWHPLERQVRVEGTATLLPAGDVAAYWASRPRGSQLGAWASPQSQVVAGRDELEMRYREAEERFAGEDVPVPPEWGGYLVAPASCRVLAGPTGSAARPAALHRHRRRLDDRAARALRVVGVLLLVVPARHPHDTQHDQDEEHADQEQGLAPVVVR